MVLWRIAFSLGAERLSIILRKLVPALPYAMPEKQRQYRCGFQLSDFANEAVRLLPACPPSAARIVELPYFATRVSGVSRGLLSCE